MSCQDQWIIVADREVLGTSCHNFGNENGHENGPKHTGSISRCVEGIIDRYYKSLVRMPFT